MGPSAITFLNYITGNFATYILIFSMAFTYVNVGYNRLWVPFIGAFISGHNKKKESFVTKYA